MTAITSAMCGAMLLGGGAMMPAGVAGEARAVVERFSEALDRKDVTAMAALLTEDTVFENTAPAPDGTRYSGKAEVVAFWQKWIVANADARFETEEIVEAGDRVTVRWVYRKMRDGKPWHLRGIDLFTVRDGKIAAKLSYVKG